jgi:hypothetical protein
VRRKAQGVRVRMREEEVKAKGGAPGTNHLILRQLNSKFVGFQEHSRIRAIGGLFFF